MHRDKTFGLGKRRDFKFRVTSLFVIAWVTGRLGTQAGRRQYALCLRANACMAFTSQFLGNSTNLTLWCLVLLYDIWYCIATAVTRYVTKNDVVTEAAEKRWTRKTSSTNRREARVRPKFLTIRGTPDYPCRLLLVDTLHLGSITSKCFFFPSIFLWVTNVLMF